MASIKEIAKLAEVSVGTASFVLNGKGDQMRISEATQKKVLEAAKALNYRPNITARRLRSGNEKFVPVIAILWSLDTRASLISRYLKGIQDKYTQGQEIELLIQPYETSKLDQLESLITGTRYNGAIITNASQKDLDYLESTDINVPLVLYLRTSKKYSYVNVENYKTGNDVAELFASRLHQSVGIIIPDIPAPVVHERKEGFVQAIKAKGINLSLEHVIFDSFSEEGGYNAIKKLLKSKKLPNALFILSDQMAIGALAALHEAGIRVPEDLEIIGHDNYDQTRFSIPSLSTINLPVEEMAGRCVSMILDLMEHRTSQPITEIYNTSFVFRQSCGGFLETKDKTTE